MITRGWRWTFAAIGGLLVLLLVLVGVGSRTSVLRRVVSDTLADRFGSEVELGAFSVDLAPVVRVRGEGLVLRQRGRRDVPPLITIRGFQLDGGIMGLLSRPRRFHLLRLDGLEIAIPPGGIKNAGAGSAPAGPSSGSGGASAIVVDRVEAHDATLALIPRQAGKEPRVFAMRRLTLESVGVAERIPFDVELTNPLPKGLVIARGTFGPWQKGEPGATPVGGSYTFNHADLSTIKGLGGTLDSTGSFAGQLGRIEVKGETRSTDFSLDIARHPMPLTTTFAAVVDGTDGDTYLDSVTALLGATRIAAKGSITRTPGVKGRTVAIHADIADGRIEDLLQLAVRSEQPLMTGAVALKTDLTLPPGEPDVVERLRLDGQFDLDAARFTDRTVQSKIAGMSQRARGADAAVPADNVMSDLRGSFRLRNGGLMLSQLTFGVPGATVRLDGSYGLRTEVLQFDGTLRMDATISQVAGGGVKSFVLKAIDPLFRKDKAGAVIPIRVRGTREQPKFGLDVARAISRK
jgi:AsmA-like C-terminal region